MSEPINWKRVDENLRCPTCGDKAHLLAESDGTKAAHTHFFDVSRELARKLSAGFVKRTPDEWLWQERAEQLEAALREVRRVIDDDGLAITFQTMGQYRTMLRDLCDDALSEEHAAGQSISKRYKMDTQWQRAVEAAAMAGYEACSFRLPWETAGEGVRSDFLWRAEIELKAALPVLFEPHTMKGPVDTLGDFFNPLVQAVYQPILDAHRRALEAEADE